MGRSHEAWGCRPWKNELDGVSRLTSFMQVLKHHNAIHLYDSNTVAPELRAEE